MVLANLLSDTGRDILIALALLVITATLLLRLYRRLPRRTTTMPTIVKSPRAIADPASAGSERAPRLSTPVEVSRWQVEMHELARELSGRLDSKLGALEQLTLIADQRIAHLEQLLEQSGSSTAKSSNSANGPAAENPDTFIK